MKLKMSSNANLVEPAQKIKLILAKEHQTPEDQEIIINFVSSIDPLNSYLENFTMKTFSLLCRSMKLVTLNAD